MSEVTRRANEYKKRLKQEDEDRKAREAEAARLSAQKKQEKSRKERVVVTVRRAKEAKVTMFAALLLSPAPFNLRSRFLWVSYNSERPPRG